MINKEIDYGKMQVRYKIGEDSIYASILHYRPDNCGEISLMSDNEFVLYWSNQTCRYYAVPTKIAYRGDYYGEQETKEKEHE